MIRLEQRAAPSRLWTVATPVLAVLLTMVAGGILFAALGKDPVAAIRTIFWDPLFSPQFAAYSRPQLLVKAAPLILIAIGLSIGFRAGVWNIGAEGQYIVGAICGAAVGLAFYPAGGRHIFPLMVLAAALGGWVDDLIMRLADFSFAFPALLFAIMLAAVFGPSLTNAIIAIAFINIPVFARVTRASAHQVWTRGYVLAARGAGRGTFAITVEHVLPNIAAPIIVQATIEFAIGILAEAALSYLGLGV